LVWIETPSNPLLRVVDIRAITEAAHAADALAVVDNTFLSPIWQQPLKVAPTCHALDHQYLNGHSDVVAPPSSPQRRKCTTSAWWRTPSASRRAVRQLLTLRGVRSLHARMRVSRREHGAVVIVCPGIPASSGCTTRSARPSRP